MAASEMKPLRQSFAELNAQLSNIDWSRVKGIILDLDGVFYPERQHHLDNINILMVQSIRELAESRGHDIPLSNDGLVQIGLQSYADHGHSFNGLNDYLDSLWPGEYDLLGNDWEILHHLVHDEHIALAAKSPDYFEECEHRRRFFELIEHFDNVAILTHGSKNWTHAIVDTLGLKHQFTDDNIYSLECVDFMRKDEHEEPFIRICDDMGLNAEDVVFVDNTEGNLVIPAGLGMQTIWIQGEKNPVSQMPEHMTGQYHDIGEAGHHLEHWFIHGPQPQAPEAANSNDPAGDTNDLDKPDDPSYTS